MRVILGVGNPGSRYQYNRHNVGFMLLDYIAEALNVSFTASKFDFYTAAGTFSGSRFLFVKPSTYVNNSGIAAMQVLEQYPAELEDFLVVYDDINLDTGAFRVRASGGDGGHNGLRSIIYHLNSNNFPRLRIGIGSDFEKGRMAEYVLTDFNKSEFELLEKTFKDCSELVEDFIKNGLQKMLDTNSRKSRSDTKQNLDNKEKGD
ncbi:MAG: aminoacyl-tRNA hydrolase [Ignavibacteriaceae bacterium]